jgi:hypothetical protein
MEMLWSIGAQHNMLTTLPREFAFVENLELRLSVEQNYLCRESMPFELVNRYALNDQRRRVIH